MIRLLTHAAVIAATVIIMPGPFPAPSEFNSHRPHCPEGTHIVVIGRNLHHHKIYACEGGGVVQPIPGGFPPHNG